MNIQSGAETKKTTGYTIKIKSTFVPAKSNVAKKWNFAITLYYFHNWLCLIGMEG